jgi:hypothetical protein
MIRTFLALTLVALPILSLAAGCEPQAKRPMGSTSAAPASATAPAPADQPPAVGPKPGDPWRAIHLLINGADGLKTLEGQLPALAKLGVNTVVVEVDYNFDFASHPELKSGGGAITKAGAGQFSAACRKEGIRPVPMINCLGHQSWAENTGVLLTKHPEFDETPGQYPRNKGIYCRSWCPQNPDVNKVVFDLMDELLDAFQADAFHVGMDEVFLIGSEFCPRCKGQDPAKLFAKAVTDLHDHLKSKGAEMLMWGDRLVDGKATGLGEWEASKNGTAPAVDLIPKDVIVCPWHYEKRKDYPSIPMLLGKGFRVLPAGWNKPEAVEALIDFSLAQKNPYLLGYMATNWSTNIRKIAEFPPMIAGMQKMAAVKPAAP